MNLIKTLLITSLVIFFTGAYAQCSQKIELTRTKDANAETYGEFNLKIKGDYSGQLILIDGTVQKEVKSFSGTGISTISLTKLLKDYSYKVVLEFRNEEKFLCKTKVVLIPVTDAN
jgi:hypothetical protein